VCLFVQAKSAPETDFSGVKNDYQVRFSKKKCGCGKVGSNYIMAAYSKKHLKIKPWKTSSQTSDVLKMIFICDFQRKSVEDGADGAKVSLPLDRSKGRQKRWRRGEFGVVVW
jgi:hypothetical protein